MSELDDKIQELESKRNKKNYSILILFCVILAIFAGLYFFTRGVTKKNIEYKVDKASDSISAYIEKSKEKEIFDKKESKDSIIQITSGVYVKELEDIKQKLLTNSSSRTDIIRSIDSVLVIAQKVAKVSSDTIPVRYYRRKRADDYQAIESTISNSQRPIYYFDSIYDVQDNNKVNTLYYGNLVNKTYVDTLVKRLKDRKVPIVHVKQFKGKRGYDWKKFTIQLEYEPDSLYIGSNDIWNIKFYSYKPDKKAKDEARAYLTKQGYNVDFFPDWERKMSFFSKYPVILFYDSNNETKAKEIARELRRATGINFVTESGDGFGVSKEEKEHLFIIHYNGS